MKRTLSREILSIEPEIIDWRRHLHRNPELSFREFRTTRFIEEKLKSFGIEDIDRPTTTGLVAHIYGKKSGKPAVAAIRADIDALPMPEKTRLPYSSSIENVMHACGHDGHTAMLLAAGKILSGSRDSFCGETRLIFQHAEEQPTGGAIEMHRAGVMKGVNALLGLHLSSAFPTCVFGIKPGPLTSNVDRFDITITGRGGHCAMPEHCIDPVVAISELVMSLQTIVSRRIAPVEPAVLSICHLSAGNAYNIIPDTAFLSGTARTFSTESRKLVEREIRRISGSVADAHGAEAAVEWLEGYPSVYNDPALTRAADEVIRSRFGEEGRMDIGCIMPGEDFSYFEENCPGFFVELGTRDHGSGCDKPHHNSCYKMDENALAVGAQYEVDMIRALLDGTGALLL